DLPKVQKMITDVHSETMKNICHLVAEVVKNDADLSPLETRAADILAQSDGDNQTDDVAPVIYTKFLFRFLQNAMSDELGDADFNTLLETHLIKRTFPLLIQKDSSAWWDDIRTPDKTESRNDLIVKAFRQSVSELEAQLGADPDAWLWGKVHTLEHPHALGKVPVLRPYFNVGPYAIMGNIEVINNQMFRLNDSGEYHVFGGPAIRRIIDFADPEHAVNVLPTGNSGNITSPHYDDQALMFVNGEFRPEKMNREEIVSSCSKLLIRPKE
ncbi:MAG: penicillin acylase family protein, partial [Bacteroidetes bacterium]